MPTALPPSIGTPLSLGVFLVALAAVLAFDLGVLNPTARRIGMREALAWSAVCVGLSLAFNLWILLTHGQQPALEFLTGYIVEYALSVDNLFVFLVLFASFGVPPELQHRTLAWGILGAVALRALFVVAGSALISAFHWVIFVFGGFLILTGGKLLFRKALVTDPEHNFVARLLRRWLPLADQFHGSHFFVRLPSNSDGKPSGLKLYATPLLLVLVLIESTDVVFALDSIPAVFGITRDPFLVFTSNISAILGLRALYILLAHAMNRFHLLKYGLGLVLGFAGLRMLLSTTWLIPIGPSLGIIVLLLGGPLVFSWLGAANPKPSSRS